MALHAALESAVGLLARLVDETPAQRVLEDDGQDGDHQQAAGELGGQELPAQQDEQHEAELEDEVGRGELEDDRVGEVRAAAEECAPHGHRGIGAAGGSRPEATGEKESLEVGAAQGAGDGPLRHHGLDHR